MQLFTEKVQPPIPEGKISETESKLGIETGNDRLVEASLFIDKKFLIYAIVTAKAKEPEKIFGQKAWEDYLEGRYFARNYGNQDLTPEFIKELHKKLTQTSEPKISGKIRETGVIGASYDDGQKPVTYTKEQVTAIEQNPYLSFNRVPPEDQESTTGFIIYPHTELSSEEIQIAIEKDLKELCDWFNEEKKQPGFNSFKTAALLQRRLISIHPFLDGNGRLSRVLMNWSLENDGEAPSVIDNPSEDILTAEEKWIEEIKNGSTQFKEIKKRQEMLEQAGIKNINALFNLGQDKAFYDYIFQYFKEAPPLPLNGDKHNHQKYEDFLKEFRQEMEQFQNYLRSTTNIETANGPSQITQGGLITAEYMDYASTLSPHVIPLEIKDQFFTNIDAYRGGVIQGSIDDEKILSMFTGYSAIGTSYTALKKSHLSPTTVDRVNPHVVRQSMEYYNQMFASAYFKAKHPELPNPYSGLPQEVRDLSLTIKEHTIGGESIWNSPFASTSLNYREAKGWARHFSAKYAQDAKYGVLFKTLLPREGMVLTFGQNPGGIQALGYQHEYEALIAGGIQPSSVTGIEIYANKAGHQKANPIFRAIRTEDKGWVMIDIEDRSGEFVVRRVYDFDEKTQTFQLKIKEQTDVPSARPIEEPFIYQPWGEIISSLYKEYATPFKENFYYKKNLEFNITNEESIFIKYKDAELSSKLINNLESFGLNKKNFYNELIYKNFEIKNIEKDLFPKKHNKFSISNLDDDK